jgi:hypothetical protein
VIVGIAWASEGLSVGECGRNLLEACSQCNNGGERSLHLEDIRCEKMDRR